MSTAAFHQECACPCGASRFAVAAEPLARFLCHCTICQSVYRKPYADVTVLWARDVELPERHEVEFRRYRLPPAVDRGTCASCGAPVVGFMRLPSFGGFAFVPGGNYPDQDALPNPRVHIFYHRRVADIDDALPKYSGYWRSELAVILLLTSAIFRGRARA